MATLPSTSLTGAAIRDNINSFGGSADNDWLNFFQANDVNKWSKYKPVIYPAAHPDDSTNWWKASDGCCGFVKSSIVFSDTSALVSAYRNGAAFAYQPPTGGSNAPYRGGDWRRYNKDALAPIWSFEIGGGQLAANNSSSSSTFTILGNGDIDTNTNLRMSDILFDGTTAVESLRFGIIITDNSGNIKLTKSTSTAIGSAANFTQSITVTAGELAGAGNYIAYPMFIDPTGKKYVACPIGAVSFKVVTSVDAEKFSWMVGTGFATLGTKFTVGAQIGYSKSFGGVANIAVITPQVMRSSGEIVNLAASETISVPAVTTEIGYYTYSRTLSLPAIQPGDTYRLYMIYGSNYANTDIINLPTPTVE